MLLIYSNKLKPHLFLILFYISFVLLMLCSCGENPNIKKGKDFFEIGDYQNAAASFEAAIQDEPKNAEAHFLLAEVYQKLDKENEAMHQYNFAIKLRLKSALDRFIEKGNESLEQGHSYSAAEFFELALKVDSTNSVASHELGKIRFRNGDTIEGLKLFRTALTFSKDNSLIQSVCETLKEYHQILSLLYISNLTNKYDGYSEFGPPSFSFDSKRIAWCRVDVRTRLNRTVDLFVMDMSSQNPIRIAKGRRSCGFPSFSPDGNSLVYTNEYQIYSIVLQNKEVSKIAQGQYPSISADGGKITFAHTYLKDNVVSTDETYEIYISNFDGSGLRRLTNNKYPDLFPKFSSSGDKIFYLSYRNKELSLYEIDIQGQSERKIKTLNSTYEPRWPYSHAYDISPDNKTLVYFRYETMFLINLESGEEREMGVEGSEPCFSKDGRAIAFKMRGGNWDKEICLIDLVRMDEIESIFSKENKDNDELLEILKQILDKA